MVVFGNIYKDVCFIDFDRTGKTKDNVQHWNNMKSESETKRNVNKKDVLLLTCIFNLWHNWFVLRAKKWLFFLTASTFIVNTSNSFNWLNPYNCVHIILSYLYIYIMPIFMHASIRAIQWIIMDAPSAPLYIRLFLYFQSLCREMHGIGMLYLFNKCMTKFIVFSFHLTDWWADVPTQFSSFYGF